MPESRNMLAPAVFVIVALGALAVGWRDWQRVANLPAWRADPRPSTLDEPPPVANAVSPHTLAGLALFGTPDADDPATPTASDPSTVNEADLPPASADYQLFGIIEADVQGRARAILGTADGEQREYKIGDVMKDGIRLHAVRQGAVIFEREGRLERLALPRSGDGAVSAPLQGFVPGQLPGNRIGRRPPARFAQPNLTPPADVAAPPLDVPMAPTEVPPPIDTPPPLPDAQ